jgi:hypothetical protein
MALTSLVRLVVRTRPPVEEDRRCVELFRGGERIRIHSKQLPPQTQAISESWLQCYTLAEAESTRSMDPPRHASRERHDALTPRAQSALLLHRRLGWSGRNLATSGEQAERQWSHVHYHQNTWSCDALHSPSATLCHTEQNSSSFPSGHCYGVHFRVHLSPEPVAEWMVEQELVRHSEQEPANWPLGWHGKGPIKVLIRHRNLGAYIHDIPLLSLSRNSMFDVLFVSPVTWDWSPWNLCFKDKSEI